MLPTVWVSPGGGGSGAGLIPFDSHLLKSPLPLDALLSTDTTILHAPIVALTVTLTITLTVTATVRGISKGDSDSDRNCNCDNYSDGCCL